MGMSQPLIGTFSIPVGALKTKTENKRIESIAIVDSIIEFLKGQLMKDDQTLQREGSESSFKRASSLSANAQKRMSKKMEKRTAQAVAARGAKDEEEYEALVEKASNNKKIMRLVKAKTVKKLRKRKPWKL